MAVSRAPFTPHSCVCDGSEATASGGEASATKWRLFPRAGDAAEAGGAAAEETGDQLEVDKTEKKRKRTSGEKEDTMRTESGQETGEDVEIMQVVRHAHGKEDTLEDNVEDKVTVDGLPCGLVRRTRDASVCVKEEPMTFSDEQMEEEVVVEDVGSPMELEVLESSEESDVELEVEFSEEEEETAIDLEVVDSESDEDFLPCLEMAIKLEKAKVDTQLSEFSGAVQQLTSYLVDKKHLVVDELDGCLFAYKRITDEELEEIGRAIRSLMAVGMKLPLRPTIKLALYDLHTIVHQLEVTLGLRPFIEKFSRYVLVNIAESNSIGNGEVACFCKMHMQQKLN